MGQSHEHVEPQGVALAAAARGALERSGERWTALRQGVFDALAGFDKPASAYEIADLLSQHERRRVAANSVYRILDLFVAANLALRVESANAYIVNAHPGCRHDCIFLVCDACGQTTHLDDDRVTGILRRSARQAGFSPSRPIVEVRGRCAKCDAA